MKELPTPQELAMQVLGEIPEGTPETWGEVNNFLERMYPGVDFSAKDSEGNPIIPFLNCGTFASAPIFSAWKEGDK
jgi:hypothetical protein